MPSIAFDIYGTLIDPLSVGHQLEEMLGDRAAAFNQLWRSKQLEYGIAGATRVRVAERAGVKAPAIHHFAGTHAAVVQADIERAVAQITGRFEEQLEDDTAADRLNSILDALFEGRLVDEQSNQLIDQIMTHAYRDQATRAAVIEMYGGFRQLLEGLLREAKPWICCWARSKAADVKSWSQNQSAAGVAAMDRRSRQSVSTCTRVSRCNRLWCTSSKPLSIRFSRVPILPSTVPIRSSSASIRLSIRPIR